jgi:hypothetical protein
MAIVNSEKEADILRCLSLLAKSEAESTPVGTLTPVPEVATVHIGFHDRFIEGEYLTVRGK